MTNQNARQFPLVDYRYHTANLGNFTGRCVRTAKFRDISREYFDVEANHAFLSDAAVFMTLIGAALVRIVSSDFEVMLMYEVVEVKEF